LHLSFGCDPASSAKAGSISACALEDCGQNFANEEGERLNARHGYPPELLRPSCRQSPLVSPLAIVHLASSSPWTPRFALNTIHKTIYCRKALWAPLLDFLIKVRVQQQRGSLYVRKQLASHLIRPWLTGHFGAFCRTKPYQERNGQSALLRNHAHRSLQLLVPHKKKSAIHPGGGKSRALCLKTISKFRISSPHFLISSGTKLYCSGSRDIMRSCRLSRFHFSATRYSGE
jgi:hypothetical protein